MLVRPPYGAAMPHVVEHQRPVVEQLEHILPCIWIIVAAAVRDIPVCVQINAVIHIILPAVGHHFEHTGVRLLGVHHVILVIGQHYHIVFPRAVILPGDIFHQFVNHVGSLRQAFHRHSPHGYLHSASVHIVFIRPVRQGSQYVVGAKRAVVVKPRGRLPYQQPRVVERTRGGGYVAVVIQRAAKKQHVAQPVPVAIGAAVVEHFCQFSVCHHVWRSRRKFIEDERMVNHKHPHGIDLLVQCRHAASLGDKFPGGDDNHVGSGLGVQVLSVHAAHERGRGECSVIVERHIFPRTACRRREPRHATAACRAGHLDGSVRNSHIPYMRGLRAARKGIHGLRRTTRRRTERQLRQSAHVEAASVINRDIVQPGDAYRPSSGKSHRKVEVAAPKFKLLNSASAIDESIFARECRYVVGRGRCQCITVVPERQRAAPRCRCGKARQHRHIGSLDNASKVEVERLRGGVAEILAKQVMPRFTGREKLRLVESAPGKCRYRAAATERSVFGSQRSLPHVAAVGDEVISRRGIRVLVLHIIHPLQVRCLPRGGSLGIEQQSAAGSQHRHLRQVVYLVGIKGSRDWRTAISKYFHLGWVGKSPPRKHGIGDGIYAGFAHRHFHPTPRRKHTVRRIVRRIECPCHRGSNHQQGYQQYINR